MSSPRPLARAALAILAGLALAAAGVVAVAEPEGAPSRAGYAPDPAVRPSAKQWVFDVQHVRGRSWISSVRPVMLDRPAATARVMGRFAIELYVGQELLDRVRFNVPLTGDAPERPSNVLLRRPTFDEGVTARLRVQMADNPRASWAKLVDRKTGAEHRFAWPPQPDGSLASLGASPAALGASPAALDGGVPADAGRLPRDGGWPADAGRLPVDAGPPVDAGRPDAGQPDGGWPPMDAGPPDGGWPPVDAGRPDGGWPPVDAGLPDGGWPPVDAGRSDAGQPPDPFRPRGR